MEGSYLAKMGLIGDFLLALIKTTVLVWGALTNWAYRIIHNSSEVVKAFAKVWLLRFFYCAHDYLIRCDQRRQASMKETLL